MKVGIRNTTTTIFKHMRLAYVQFSTFAVTDDVVQHFTYQWNIKIISKKIKIKIVI